MKNLVSGIMLTLLSTSMLMLTFSFRPISNFDAHSSSAVTRVESGVDFLILSQFDSNLSLCREAPLTAPNNFWLVSDNLWAFKALKMANESGLSSAAEAGAVAEKIREKIMELAAYYGLPTDAEGLPISYANEAVIGDFAPPPYRTNINCTLYSNDYVLNTTMRNGTIMDDWYLYADLSLYASLSYHWRGDDEQALNYYMNVVQMWNATSEAIQDKAANESIRQRGVCEYDTYKLALLLYTSKILGKKLPFEFELVDKIWSLQRETDGGIITGYLPDGTSCGDANTETTSLVIIATLTIQRPSLGTFTFYYPWYGTPFSGNWRHWPPDGSTNITDHPLLGFYDSNNETLIKEHIDIAKEANIDGFIVSWWGVGSFEDNATSHIKNVCEQNGFKFTVYYENTSSVNQTVNDIIYLLNKYANSSAWYKVDNRPVIYVFFRARNNLNPQAWKLYGYYINESQSVQEYWMLSEDVRKPPRCGIFPIHPYPNGIGFVESANPIFLPPNETYKLKTAISDIRNDCPSYSDVGFRIKVKNETEDWKILDERIVNFNDGWLDLGFDLSNYAGQNVSIRVESFDGGLRNWCSEWAAVDYLYIENSKGQIVSYEPFFDNCWKDVVDEIGKRGFNPYFIMDFTGYQNKVQDFAGYFLNFTEGIHFYNPVDVSEHLPTIFYLYDQASNAAHSMNKAFVATVIPGYNDTANPQYVIDRQDGTYYKLFWSIAKACSPDGYAITSFNEWHEGTEIEPSLEYGDKYIKLSNNTPKIWIVDDDKPADFCTIQEAISNASPGDIVYVRNGTYHENIVLDKTLMLIGESRNTTVIDGKGAGTVIFVNTNNTIIKSFTIRNSGERQDNEWPSGIWLNNASNCTLLNNHVTNNTLGIMLYSSSSNLLKNNSMTANRYNFGVLGWGPAHFNHDIDVSNTVDGKPIYYLVNCHGGEVPLDAGYVAVINSTNIMVKNLNLQSNYEGILFAYTHNSTITNNTSISNLHGICLIFSSNNTILDNTVAGKSYYGFGIGLSFSSNNLVLGNTVTDSMYGISLAALSSNNTVSQNSVANNSLEGIELLSSSTNIILSNTIENNGESGIEFHYDCFDNMVTNNTITNNKCGINLNIGPSPNTFSSNAIANNKDFGVSLLRSSNNTFFGNHIINNNCYGIALYDSSNQNTFRENNIINNTRYAISLSSSANNTFCGNNIAKSEYGVYLSAASNNKFCHNNFTDNVHSTMNFGYTNVWDDGYPSGGNYWSNYNGTDLFNGVFQNVTGSDGVGDTALIIDANNRDGYPLMAPINIFNVGIWKGEPREVYVVSNSTISRFQLNATEKIISFNVTGESCFGFSRITIPNVIIQDLWQANYTVLLDGEPWPFRNWTEATNTYIYLNYTHSEHEIVIIPESPSIITLQFLMLTTLIATILRKKKGRTKTQTP